MLVLIGGPRRTAHQFLAAFLLLIAANQAVELLRALTSDPARNLLLFKIATVFSSLDPFFLYAFASVYPTTNALGRRGRLAAVGAGSMLFALSAIWILAPDQAPHVHYARTTGLDLFTAAVYTVVLLHVLKNLADRPEARGLGALFVALCVAALPVWSRTAASVLDAYDYATGLSVANLVAYRWAQVAVGAIALLLATLLIARSARRFPSGSRGRRVVAVGILTGVAFVLVLDILLFTRWLEALKVLPVGTNLGFLGNGSAALRWWLFGLLGSTAVLRYDLFGMTLAARRAAARTVVGLIFVALAALILFAFDAAAGRSVGVSPVEGLLLAVVLIASQTFRPVVDSAAYRLYAVPKPGDLAASLETYRAAVRRALDEGRSVEDAKDLARLRGELGLDARTAGVVERMAENSSSGPLVVGSLVGGRYRLEATIARGEAGRVYRARDELLERHVVLKEIANDEQDDGSRALAEARLAGGLRHANIVTVYDVVERRGASLIVTEFVEGGSLADRIRRDGPLSLRAGLDLVDGILAGLELVHARGIVHRDLKPANVLMGADGSPKIADFGIARLRSGRTVRFQGPRAIEGTPQYMAPEQRRGEPTTPATDLFAIGLLLRHCVKRPLPAGVERVVGRALQDSPSARWSSAAEMRRELQEARERRTSS